MSSKIKFKTPTKQNTSVYPVDNGDIERLGWTRIALADVECGRLRETQETSRSRNCGDIVEKTTRLCGLNFFKWSI